MARSRFKIDDVEEEDKNNILVYKHNDELYIERAALYFSLYCKGKQTFYPTLDGAFRALSKSLLYDHFGRIPNEEKNDIKRILRAIEEHDKMIKEMFKGY